MKQIIIIGGGVASKGFLSAALDFHKDIKLTVIRNFEKAPVPCGIPYAFGSLDSVNKNLSPDKNFIEAGVDFIIDTANDINLKTKELILEKNNKIKFDHLVLAAGAHSITPPIPGVNLNNVVTITKNLKHVKKLKEKINNSTNIVIVGGGFIGVEIADEISKLKGKHVSIVELENNCLSQAFDSNFCEEAENIIQDHGVKVYNKIGVKKLRGEKTVEEVILTDGKVLKADLVFLAVGAKPSTALADKAGLDISSKGGITVDKFMYTSNPYIQAIGDCANKIDFFTGNDSNIMLASVAAREGRIAAANLFKHSLPLEPAGTINLFSTALGKIYFGAAGLTEKNAEKLEYNYKTITVKAPDKHPSALPETNEIKGKFIFNNTTGVLLGAQLQGSSQVAELINLLGMIIQQKIPANRIFNNLYGTHPLGTSAPNKYIIHAAARKMIKSYFNN